MEGVGVYVHTATEMGLGVGEKISAEVLLDGLGYIGVPSKINVGNAICVEVSGEIVLATVPGETTGNGVAVENTGS